MATEQTNDETPAGRSPETVDRILIGACSAIWLILLAVTVVSIVALVRLANGHAAGGHSSWLLYSIIAVSALIIAGAIPLLLRARRGAESGAAEAPADEVRAPVAPAESPTEKIRVFGVDPYRREPVAAPVKPAIPEGVLDRLWLRGTVSLVAAMGLALIGVSTATYLLANNSDTAAWVALGVAGVITVAMPAVLVFHQRMVAEVVEAAG